ncbi:MAG: hypothetical protein PHI11_14185 [Gallionella sp.]|nr:hypothetical protein [Gallionella sp.]
MQFPLSPIAPTCTGEVAHRWVYQDGAGEVGQITSVTQVFCHECTRTRLSTDGKLYTCLFADQARVNRYSALRQTVVQPPRQKIEMS